MRLNGLVVIVVSLLVGGACKSSADVAGFWLRFERPGSDAVGRPLGLAAGHWQDALMGKTYRNFFLFEVVVIIAVVFVFRTIQERIVAGAIAGTLFVLLGLVIVGWGIKVSAARRTPTFFAGLVHLFGSALPLMVTRYLNSAVVFEDVRVLGMPGPVFHQVSSYIYLGLMIATVFDWVRSRKAASAA